ncbi:MAG: CZB domain-containing protein, partial [Thiogranum sp.]
MSQAVISDLNHNMDDELNAFSFWVGDSLFAINLEQVLSVEQDSSAIQPDPFEGRGALGIVKHRGVPVRVFDFAEFLGVSSCSDQKEELIKTLSAREQDHIDWLNALECSIKTNEAFAKARDPHQCAFGKWYDRFHTRDEELMDILRQFNVPHKRIHSLADRLLMLKERGNAE